MTHQEMIDYWQKEIEKNESAAMFMSTFQQMYMYKDRAEYARMIYMQLCQMETNEPITITSLNNDETAVMLSGDELLNLTVQENL